MDDLNLENAVTAPEVTPEEQGAPAAPESEITLDESGELNIPDSFFEGLEPEAKPETKTEEPEAETKTEPAYYTPEEFAAAFAGGNIDEAKLRPEVAEFYRAAVKQQPMTPPLQQPQPPVQAGGAPAMTPQQYTALREAAKRVAAQSYLGIKPEEFDDMDPTHAEAARFAMGQIQTRAREIAATRAAEAVRAQQLSGEIQSLDAEYQKDPEFYKNHEALMHEYLGRMPFRAAAEAIRAIQTGDAAGIRKFLGSVYSDYKAAAAGKGERKAAAVPPPPVMKAGGLEEGKHAGMVDVSGLGEMSPEDLAEWLVKNEFAI